MKLDHVVIFVSDLERATRDFSDLGFTVTKGGSHGRTENALIIFQDGTYIELLALTRNWLRPVVRLTGRLGFLDKSAARKQNMYWRLLRWISGDTGFVDWCVRVDDVKSTLDHWAQENVDLIQPEMFCRLRPDGKNVKWYLSAAKDFNLPFILEDITPIDLRVPLNDTTNHSNGAIGIYQIDLYVDDVETITTLHKRLCIGERAKVSLKHKTAQSPRISLKLLCTDTTPCKLNTKKSHNASILMIPA